MKPAWIGAYASAGLWATRISDNVDVRIISALGKTVFYVKGNELSVFCLPYREFVTGFALKGLKPFRGLANDIKTCRKVLELASQTESRIPPDEYSKITESDFSATFQGETGAVISGPDGLSLHIYTSADDIDMAFSMGDDRPPKPLTAKNITNIISLLARKKYAFWL